MQGEHETHNEEAHDEHDNNTQKNLIENPDENKETGETTKGTEEVSTKEGNNNNEDDEDVQVQGDSYSEYSDIHQRSTAEAINTASAKRGNADISSGTTHETIKT